MSLGGIWILVTLYCLFSPLIPLHPLDDFLAVVIGIMASINRGKSPRQRY